jgi:hypothetical protein
MKNIIGIFILLFLILTTIQVTSSIKSPSKEIEIITGWYDNFDNYSNGQYLDGGLDDGGWRLFKYNVTPDFGAFITNEIKRSYPNSLEIAGPSNILHLFEGYTSGIWNFSTWVYMPNDYIGDSCFILSSYYVNYDKENFENNITVALVFQSYDGIIVSRESYRNLPLIFDQWIEILCIIDLDSDWLEIYYNDELLDSRKWTATWRNTDTGILNINYVGLWANRATSIYYDDFSLIQYGAKPDLFAMGI